MQSGAATVRDYVQGLDYVAVLQPDLSPAWIDHVLRARGFASPRARADAFRHVDLGCGFGLTMLSLAAAYPESVCYGVDASSSQIDAAQRLADRAGLANARFVCARFGDAALAEAAGADYVVANGVYSWVAPATRRLFLDEVRRLRAPHGVAVVSHNLQAGWLALLTTQRLLSDAAAGDTASGFAAARGFLDAIAAAGRDPLIAGGAKAVAEMGQSYGEAYVAHEFLVGGWAPGWTVDLAAELAPLAYRGATYLDLLHDDFGLTKAQRAAVAAAPTAAAALSYRDIAHGRSHARAIFQAPDAAPAPTRLAGWIGLTAPAADVGYACVTPAGELDFDNALARRIVALLADGPVALEALHAAAGASSEAAFWRVIDALLASVQALPTDAPKPPEAVARLRAALAEAGLDLPYLPDRHGTPTRVSAPGGA